MNTSLTAIAFPAATTSYGANGMSDNSFSAVADAAINLLFSSSQRLCAIASSFVFRDFFHSDISLPVLVLGKNGRNLVGTLRLYS